jgi:hypothetical protein
VNIAFGLFYTTPALPITFVLPQLHAKDGFSAAIM